MPRHPGQLTERQQRFVEAYAASGNAIEAATKAGYRKPHPEGSRLLRNATVAAAIAKLTGKRRSKAIATAEERQQFWTRVMNANKEKMTDRLRAAELLGKANGDFLERHEIVSGSLIDVMVYVPSNARG